MRPLPRRTPDLRPPLKSPLRTLLVTAMTTALVGAGMALATAPARAENRVTPGDFTGYGFDQCLAPSQSKMDTWMEYSPFSSVGIYISGDSRACRSQPNLTRTWISKQLANQWRILPITLGPQASCQPRFPRYGDDEKINPTATSNYAKARSQGLAEADKTVKAAQALGISRGSTLWYDLEGFDLGNTRCRESALYFLHAWTKRIHRLDYVSGVYSSAGSGIKMLDDARVNRPGTFALPDKIWIARWDGAANTSTSYIRSDGWLPGGRVKQYQGGHNETWGGVTINIDRNFLDTGKGSLARAGRTYCGTVSLDLDGYHGLNARQAPADEVKTLQCLLKGRGVYAGKVTGLWNDQLVAAVRSWKTSHGTPVSSTWTVRNWVQLLASGWSWPTKYGHTGSHVSRLQRALVAANGRAGTIDGRFFRSTENAVKAWQKRVGLSQTGVMSSRAWSYLKRGDY